jgi:hypothetical protein
MNQRVDLGRTAFVTLCLKRTCNDDHQLTADCYLQIDTQRWSRVLFTHHPVCMQHSLVAWYF